MRVLAAVVACGSAHLSASSSALADETAVEPIVVSYTADEECPRERDFFATTRRYTNKWRAVEPSAGRLRTFDVRLTRNEGGGHTGGLVITMPDGKVSAREIAGPDCASVARALAVVVALAIDPQAHVGGPAPETEAEVAPPDLAPTKPGEPSAPSSPPASSAPALPPAAPPPHGHASVELPEAPPHDRIHLTFAIEGRVELTSAVTTGALSVAGAAIEVRAHLGSTLPAWLSPSLAVGARQSLPKRIGVGSGAADFLWTAAAIRLCPVRFAVLANRLEAAPCAELNVGTLRAEALGLPGGRATSSGWFDRGASLRTTYRLSPSWSAGAGVLVTAPVSRNRFALASGELISKAPAVGVTLGLILELRL